MLNAPKLVSQHKVSLRQVKPSECNALGPADDRTRLRRRRSCKKFFRQPLKDRALLFGQVLQVTENPAPLRAAFRLQLTTIGEILKDRISSPLNVIPENSGILVSGLTGSNITNIAKIDLEMLNVSLDCYNWTCCS